MSELESFMDQTFTVKQFTIVLVVYYACILLIKLLIKICQIRRDNRAANKIKKEEFDKEQEALEKRWDEVKKSHPSGTEFDYIVPSGQFRG